eukprot:4345700-Amphidinium_carterae.2
MGIIWSCQTAIAAGDVRADGAAKKGLFAPCGLANSSPLVWAGFKVQSSSMSEKLNTIPSPQTIHPKTVQTKVIAIFTVTF